MIVTLNEIAIFILAIFSGFVGAFITVFCFAVRRMNKIGSLLENIGSGDLKHLLAKICDKLEGIEEIALLNKKLLEGDK